MVVAACQAFACLGASRVFQICCIRSIGFEVPTLSIRHTATTHRRQDIAMAPVDWSDIPPEHNLAKFAAELPEILKETGHDEMYGVKLEAEGYG